MFHDFYDILGLSTEATSEEIKRAYRKRAREAHPDRHPDDAKIRTEEMSLINEAYSALSSSQKRAEYDIEWRRFYRARGQIRRSGGDTKRLEREWSEDLAYDRPVVETPQSKIESASIPFWKNPRFLLVILIVLVLVLAVDVWLTYFRGSAVGKGVFRDIAHGYEYALGQRFRDRASERHLRLSREVPQENPDERLWRLNRALDLNPDNLEAGLEMSGLLLGAGRSDEAVEISRHALSVIENTDTANMDTEILSEYKTMKENFMVVAYRAFMGLGQMEDAHDILSELETSGVDDPQILLDHAFVELELKLTADARSHIDLLMNKNPDALIMSESEVIRIRTYLIDGDYSKAEELAKSALESDPGNAMLSQVLGETYFAQGNYAAAARYLEKGLPASTDPVNTRYMIGLSYFRSGDVQSAIASLTEVVMADPEHFDAHMTLGRAYQSIGDFQNARDHFYRALEINPESQEAKTALDGVPTE